LVSFFRDPRDGAAYLAPDGMPMPWDRLAHAPFFEFPRNWRTMMTARNGGRLAAICATVALTAAVFVLPAKAATDAKAVIKTYADIALAKYEDSLTTAQALDKAVDTLLAKPSVETLNAAREAWKAARVPYQQTEVYRFGNKVVDDWEGEVNSWPLDEGLIDYVAKSYGTESDANSLYTANVIANKEIEINGKKVDASKLTPEFLSGTLQEAGGVEANVATGYHAIEFLLWGQDLHGTGPGAGERPYTDYDLKNCTGGDCDRRAEYLKSASDLLVSDLQKMVNDWNEDGAARKNLVDGEPNTAIAIIFTGMGSLSYGELAGERMKLGLLLHDPEEEQDCFSDNTYNSHLYDAIGIRAAYHASYTRLDGTVVSGPSVSDMVKAADPAIDKELSDKLDVSVAKMEAIKARALAGEAYDQQIAEGNTEGNATVQAAIVALIDQTKSIERAVGSLKLNAIAFEGSDSLDAPDKVFK
jgi:putative iron-regulated protein